MSSFVATCATFSAVAIVLVNCAIFIHLVLSFPAICPGAGNPPGRASRRVRAPNNRGGQEASRSPNAASYKDGLADSEEPEEAWGQVDVSAAAYDCGSAEKTTGWGPTRGRTLHRRSSRMGTQLRAALADGYDNDYDYDEGVTLGRQGKTGGDKRRCAKHFGRGMKWSR